MTDPEPMQLTPSHKILLKLMMLLNVVLSLGLIFFLLRSEQVSAQTDDELFFDKTVEELIQEKLNDEQFSVKIDYKYQHKAANVRLNQDRIKSLVLQEFDLSKSTFSLGILYTDRSSEILLGKYTLYTEVPVAARYIKYGEIIQMPDISTMRLKTSFNSDKQHVSSSEIIGMQAKNYIAKGAVIKRSEIAHPPVIKNNDPVNIVYNSRAINLRTSGVAMSAGAIGDMVKVKNSTSGIVLLGQIINKNTVQVNGESNE